MMFPAELSEEDLERYFRVIQTSLAVQSHGDLLQWLQGEIQHFLPHEIMLAVWCDTGGGHLPYDVVSALPGVRSTDLYPDDLMILQQRLHGCWSGLGNVPFKLSVGAHNLKFEGCDPLLTFSQAMRTMRSLLVHGISDAREGQDCLYVIFSSLDNFNSFTLAAMENFLPYIDTALRRLVPLSSPRPTVRPNEDASQRSKEFGLTERETELLGWISLGKTNAEIAQILKISIFTVKNHVHNIFHKLNVCNRMQAVKKMRSTIGTPAERDPRFFTKGTDAVSNVASPTGL
jgi:transcriptional regulator EpsA